MKKWILIVVAVASVIAIWFYCSQRDLTLTVGNASPFDQLVSVSYLKQLNQRVTHAPIRLASGSKATVKAEFDRDINPDFRVSVRLVGSLVQPVYGVPAVQFGGDHIGCAADTTVTAPDGSACPQAGQEVPFASIEMDNADLQRGTYTALLPAPLPGGQPGELIPVSADPETALKDAHDLQQTLNRRIPFVSQWSNRIMPYLCGCDLGDDNTLYGRGVRVISAQAQTPFGFPVPLQPGDEIVSFGENAQPLFAPVDFRRALIDFALTRGITEAFVLGVIRDGKLLEVRATFFFNPDAFPQDVGSPGRTAWFSFVDGATLGFQAETHCGAQRAWNWLAIKLGGHGQNLPSFDRCVFDLTQTAWRLAQFNRDAAQLAQFAGGMTSLARSIGTRFLRAAGKTGLTYRVVRSVAIESGEAAVTTYRQTPRGLAMGDQLKYSIPVGAGVGLITAVAGR